MKSMISPSEAFELIMMHPFSREAEWVTTGKALGRITAEPILADRDLPPFNRAMMDGFALRWSDLQSGALNFQVVGIQQAGKAPRRGPDAGGAIEIMTGAPVPENADVVVPYEDIERSDEHITICKKPDKRWKHIHTQANDAREGDVLVKAFQRIGPPEAGIAVSCGQKDVKVWRNPRMAILNTGDELVPVDQSPLTWQIRESNAFSLQTWMAETGTGEADIFHCSDEVGVLRDCITRLLEGYEALIITGGVSRGKWDHVPQTLETCGIRTAFHRISQKPGKPMWFGTARNRWVFALPGNPVSAMVCAVRYVNEWMLSSSGMPTASFQALAGIEFERLPVLTRFATVSCTLSKGALKIHPVVGNGSGDYGHLHHGQAFAEITPGEGAVQPGEWVTCYPYRRDFIR
jgi:molybdopterin molybdotransferase